MNSFHTILTLDSCTARTVKIAVGEVHPNPTSNAMDPSAIEAFIDALAKRSPDAVAKLVTQVHHRSKPGNYVLSMISPYLVEILSGCVAGEDVTRVDIANVCEALRRCINKQIGYESLFVAEYMTRLRSVSLHLNSANELPRTELVADEELTDVETDDEDESLFSPTSAFSPLPCGPVTPPRVRRTCTNIGIPASKRAESRMAAMHRKRSRH